MENVTPVRTRTDLHHTPTTFNDRTPEHDAVIVKEQQESQGAVPDEPPPRTHLSTPKQNFERLASRTLSQAILEESRACNLPASPLDAIDPSLYPRFPRFSITTESSHPDLSTDEVTSTRLSLDEEGIVATPRSSITNNIGSSKRHKLQMTLHRAMSTPTLGLRRMSGRMSDRIRRAPSILRSSTTSKRPQGKISENQAPVSIQEADNSVARSSSHSSLASQRVLQRMSINSQRSSSLPVALAAPAKGGFGPLSKLSDLPEDQASDSETAVSQGQLRAPNPLGVPNPCTQPSAVNALKYTLRPLAVNVESYHAAKDCISQRSPTFLGRASSWSNTPNSGLPRAISLGSIDELRCNSFVSTQQRVFSMPSIPNIPSRQSSLVASTCSTTRRSARTLSICDVGDMINLSQLRSDPMFVGIQEGHQVDFIFPSSSDVHTSPISPPRPSIGSKAYSYRSLRQKDSATPLLVRSASIKSGLEGVRGKAKVPLFVPSQIIKPLGARLVIPERQSSRLCPNAALSDGDAAPNARSNGQENQSKEALSEASDWSTTVQFEAHKQEVFQSKSKASRVVDITSAKRESRLLGGGKSWEARRDAQGPSPGPEEAGTNDEIVKGAAIKDSSGLRGFRSCCGYYQRIKQQLWRSSVAKVHGI